MTAQRTRVGAAVGADRVATPGHPATGHPGCTPCAASEARETGGRNEGRISGREGDRAGHRTSPARWPNPGTREATSPGISPALMHASGGILGLRARDSPGAAPLDA